MNLKIKYGLPFLVLTIQFGGQQLTLENVLLDTGSAGTIFNAGLVGKIGVKPASGDVVHTIRGIGGIEYVYTKEFEALYFENICIEHFLVEIGDMNYGMEIDGIMGFDFIQSAGLIINAVNLQVHSAER